MNLTFAKHRSTSFKEASYKAVLIDGKWFAKNGKLFPINILETDLCHTDVIFSKPDNDVYPMWTPKKHGINTVRLDISNCYWSPIKPGIELHGMLLGDKSEFLIDWKAQEKINNKELSKL